MDWSKIPGFGVAGNFAGHLEQAGESPDFVNVNTREAEAPKGIFPFYLPKSDESQLSVNPYSHDQIRLYNLDENHQIEPEVSILFEVKYTKDSNGLMKMSQLIPIQAMAHNDCSIRRPGAKKISEKKNWGPSSKGISHQSILLQNLQEDGLLDHFHLGCYLLRGGALLPYGVTSAVKDYSYFHHKLLDWMVETFNTQQDQGPLENLLEHLESCGYPQQICVSIGATRYTEIGESTFLQPDDISCVVLYDARKYSAMQIQIHLQTSDAPLPDASVLKQRVLI